MGHVVRETAWCTIDIDTRVGRVFLQERWQYIWKVQPGLAAWTADEKRDFHHRADRSIWAVWSNRASLGVVGKSDFAKRFSRKKIPINLDVRWVIAKPHWTVTVTKIPADQFVQSSFNWASRTVSLDTNDFKTRLFCTGTPKVCTTQTPVAHEFGHTAGNTAVLGRGDEYKTSSPHRGDHGSILHSGNQLRSRHFRTILEEMNKMIPDTRFSVRSL